MQFPSSLSRMLIFLYLTLSLSVVNSCVLQVRPLVLNLRVDANDIVHVSCLNGTANETDIIFVTVSSDSERLVRANSTNLFLTGTTESSEAIQANDKDYSGETYVRFTTLTGEGTDAMASTAVLRVVVTRVPKPVDDVFTYVLGVMVVMNAFNLGCTMDLSLIINHLKKPKKVFIGMLSQFLFMPMIAFALTHILKMDNALSIGCIIMGSAPGGGASNWVSFMLGGDLELSIVMTFCSTIAAVGFMPMWLFLLTRDYTDDQLKVPYGQIAVGLLLIIIPTIIGIVCQFKLPRVAKFFESIIPQFGAVAVAMAISTGVYSNLYLLFYPWQPWLCGFLLPFCGFNCGYLFSSLFRVEHRYRVTICVETGIQNSVLSVAIATLAFEAPFSDEVIAVPLFAALLTGVQTLTTVSIYLLWKRRQAKDLVYVEGDGDDAESSQKNLILGHPVGSRSNSNTDGTGQKKPPVQLHYHALADDEDVEENTSNGKGNGKS